MAERKNKTRYYQKLYKQYMKAGGLLSSFCRKRGLNYDRVRKAFLRLKASGKIRDNKEGWGKSGQKPTNSGGVLNGDVSEIAKKNGKSLTRKQQRLLELELSSVGKTNGQLAKEAGYDAANLSKAFIDARKGEKYQEALARSRVDLQEKIGIPGEMLLIRLLEIGLSRPSDILEILDGEIRVRTDIDFSEGGDLAIKSITVKNNEVSTDKRTVIKKELKFEMADNMEALISAIKIGGYFDDSVFNSLAGGSEEVQELWKRFKDQEISANEFSMELAMRGLAVPKSLEIQAKEELKVMAKRGGDDDLSDVNLMDGYDEMLEDTAIAKKKLEVETQRKKELEERDKALKELNQKEEKDCQL